MTQPAPPPRPELSGGFDFQRFAHGLGKVGHGKALGIRYHAEGSDWVELELPWNPALIGDEAAGIMASGPIFALMDNVTSLSVWQKMDGFRPQATLDFRIDYIRPARHGRAVVGRGECLRLTRSIAFVRGIAYDDAPDDPVAHVAGTFMFTGPKWTG